MGGVGNGVGPAVVGNGVGSTLGKAVGSGVVGKGVGPGVVGNSVGALVGSIHTPLTQSWLLEGHPKTTSSPTQSGSGAPQLQSHPSLAANPDGLHVQESGIFTHSPLMHASCSTSHPRREENCTVQSGSRIPHSQSQPSPELNLSTGQFQPGIDI